MPEANVSERVSELLHRVNELEEAINQRSELIAELRDEVRDNAY